MLVGSPLDTLKVRAQLATSSEGASLAVAARTLIRTEGLSGLFKGASAMALAQAPINATIFGANHFATLWMQERQGGAPLSIPQLFVGGSFSGMMQSLVLSPFELIKTQQQMHSVGRRGAHRSLVEVMGTITQQLGPLGLYRGMSATLLRDGPTFGLYFLVYERARTTIHDALSGDENNWGHRQGSILAAGGLAGAASWAVALPADVVKSNIQGAPLDAPKSTLRVFTVASRILREDGLKGFFRGFVPCVLRSIPVNAVTFLVLEGLRDARWYAMGGE